MSYLTERRLEEKERRRIEILDAAEAVASIVGIEAMTMDQVAKKARLSRALLYVYFGDKSDLLTAVCTRARSLKLASNVRSRASSSGFSQNRPQVGSSPTKSHVGRVKSAGGCHASAWFCICAVRRPRSW